MEDRVFALIVILGLAAASLAGVSAYLVARKEHPTTSGSAQKTSPVLPTDQLTFFRDFSRDNKLGPSVSIAHALPPRDFDTLTIAPKETPSRAGSTQQVSIPLPPRRPQHFPRVLNGLLNDAQITGIKSRLRLSPKQAEYWPKVEEALRDVARRHLQDHVTHQNGARIMEVNSPEVKRLVEASAPLIRELREDQKRELRELVRMIGLGTVASHI